MRAAFDLSDPSVRRGDGHAWRRRLLLGLLVAGGLVIAAGCVPLVGGSVTTVPAGISCGSTCVASFDADAVVVLSASTDSGATFAGWSGACSGTGTCQVTMNSNKQVVARFTYPR